MILTRPGSKSQIADDIHKHFPAHNSYIELFFGAGGMFFNKPQVKYNICNDIDNEVYNLWSVMQTDSDKLKEEVEQLPMHNTLWNEYKKKEVENPILKAALFLMYSNYGYMGKPNTLHFPVVSNNKKCLLEKFDATLSKMQNVLFMCEDFRNVLSRCFWRSEGEIEGTFIYADPPYFETAQYSNKFTEKDTIDLFEMLVNSKMKFAISEFNNKKILELANDYKLNIITIGERQNMKNRRTEILVTNYKKPLSLFDGV
jgi:DNA adenine methylase